MITEFSLIEWGFTILCAILIGISKAGVPGAGMIGIPLLASVFGGRLSTGIILPMLIMADIFAVKYYHRHAHWQYILKILPWALAGIVIGMFIGNSVSDITFKRIIAVVIIVCIILMVWQKWSDNKVIPDYVWFSAVFGLAGGFATMIGNAAGPILTIYLLSMRLPKNIFIGTRAWFFLIVNVTKFPLHFFVWETISPDSLLVNIIMLPAIALGIYLGIAVVKKLPEKIYWYVIVIITFVASLFLF